MTDPRRPDFLSPYHASAFADADVVRAYRYRPPYPDETFEIIRDLMVEPRIVLDVGSGDGALARPMARHAKRVEALDPSLEMIAQGRRLAGNDANIRWIQGRVENAQLDGPYGLIIAGASVHWWDWDVALPRLAGVTAPGARFVVVHADSTGGLWKGDLIKIIAAYSLFTDWREFDVVAELTQRGLFVEEGRRRTAAIEVAQPIDDYVVGLFSHSSLARTRLGPERAASFEKAVRDLLHRSGNDDHVLLTVTADLVWGRPLARTST